MAKKLCGVSFQGKERYIYIYFQSVNLFNVPLLKVAALDGLRRGAGWQGLAWGRCSCPGSGCVAVGFRGGAFFSYLFLNKALKWEADPMFLLLY